MNSRIACLVLAVLALAFHPTTSFAEKDELADFILSDGYRKAFYTPEPDVKVAFSEVRFVNGVKVDNCEDYLKQKRISQVDYDNDWNTRYDCEYVGCRFLAELTAHGKPHKGYRPKSYAKEVFNRLDWKSFSGTGMVFPSEEKHTFAELNDPQVEVVDNRMVRVVRPKVWHMELTIVADADINGNGKPDWLFQKYERALGGTLFFCTSGVIWDVEPTGLLKAVEF